MATINSGQNSGLYSFSNVVVNQPYGNSNVTSYLATGSDTGGNVLGNIVTNSRIQSATLSVVGNATVNALKTDNYLFANGTPINLAGTYGNANVVSFLASGNSAVISTTGNITTTANITGGYILGNGSQLTGLPATYGNANVVANLAALGSNPVSTTGNVTASYVIGNGSLLANITAGNITGTVANATYATNAGIATFATTANAVAGANVSGTVANATYATTAGIATFATTANAVAGANVSGTVANATFATSAATATTADTVTTAAQGNITSVGTLTSLSVSGNITGNYILGNGSALTGLGATYTDANVVTLMAGFGSNTVSTTGNITAGYFLGNGSQLTGLPATYGNAEVAAYLPYNTSDIAGTNQILTGNLTVGQDLVVNGNTQYTNIDTFTVQDPIIELGRGANNAPLTVNDGKDRGSQLWYYIGAEGSAFVGFDNSSGEMALASNVSIANNIVTYNDYGTTRVGNLTGVTASLTGNVTSNYFLGNGSQLTGLPATYGNSNVAAFMANYGANTISLNGNISIGNTTGQVNNYYSLKFPTSNATQTMSMGTANATALTIDVTNSTGNTYAQMQMTRKRIDQYVEDDLTYGNAIWAGYQADINTPSAPYFTIYAQSNTASGGDWYFYGSNAAMTAPGNITTTTGNLNAVGLSLSGNVLSAINSVANITTTGNITGGYVNGNGSLLTNLTAGNIVGTVATATSATTAGTVTSAAQANITSVGTLTSLSVSGNIDGANINGNGSGLSSITGANVTGTVAAATTATSATTAGTVTTAAQPSITSVGTLTSLSVTGTITGGNLATGGTASATGNITGGNISTGGLITATGNITGGNLTGVSGSVATGIINYKDYVATITYGATITPNIALGSIQQVTLTGGVTMNAFGGTPQAGQSMVIKFIQDATGGRTLSSTMKWAGGNKTLSTAANAVDIASVFFDGTTYYASLTLNYS